MHGTLLWVLSMHGSYLAEGTHFKDLPLLVSEQYLCLVL